MADSNGRCAFFARKPRRELCQTNIPLEHYRVEVAEIVSSIQGVRRCTLCTFLRPSADTRIYERTCQRVYVTEPKSPSIAFEQIDLTVSPHICDKDHQAGTWEALLPSKPKLGQGIVPHESMAEACDVELSEARIVRYDAGADLQVDEGCGDAVLVNVDPSTT